MYLSDSHTNEIFSRRVFFLTKQTFYETNLPRNVMEKYYTWVDVQFLILVSSLLFLMFLEILFLVSCLIILYVVTCFIASSSILIVRYAHEIMYIVFL